MGATSRLCQSAPGGREPSSPAVEVDLEDEGGDPAAVSVEAFMEATKVETFEPSMAVSAGLLALIALGFALVGRRKASAD